MPIRHTIVRGESCSSLALRYGFAPDTIWEDPDNDGLRAARAHMDVLDVGDVVVIPDKREKIENAAVDRRHTFRRRGVPMLFTLYLYDTAGEPYAGASYVLEVDGGRHVAQGTIDGDGKLECFLPNDSKRGELTFADEQTRSLLLGHLAPVTTLEGVQQRLSNLGFPCLGDRGEMGRTTMAALLRFQRFTGLEVNGEVDDAIREEVRACYEDPAHFLAHFEED